MANNVRRPPFEEKENENHDESIPEASALAAVAISLLSGNATPVYAGCCEEGTKELLAEHITDYSPIPGATDLPGARTRRTRCSRSSAMTGAGCEIGFRMPRLGE